MYNYLYENILQKYGNKNKLVIAMMYQLDTLNDFENVIIELVTFIQEFFNRKYHKHYSLDILSTILIYLFNSYILIHNLPELMDVVKYKNKSAIHIIYSEALSQLLSISFYSECIDLFNIFIQSNKLSDEKIIEISNINSNLYNNHYQTLLDEDINEDKSDNKFQVNDDLYNLLTIKNINTTEKKRKLEKNLKDYQCKLLHKLSIVSFRFFNCLINDIEISDKQVIYQKIMEKIEFLNLNS